MGLSNAIQPNCRQAHMKLSWAKKSVTCKRRKKPEGLTGNYQKLPSGVLSSRRGFFRSAKTHRKPYASLVMRRLRLRLPARAASAVAAGALTVASLTSVAYADGAYHHAPPPPPDPMGDASAFDSDPISWSAWLGRCGR
jgi:hypothetical protein